MPLSGIKTRHIKIIIAIIVLIISSFFLFYNLGHYALWDDEATTALFAQSVWRTGDTSAIRAHNLVAYKSGIELEDFRNRYVPPLQFYLAAPFVGLFPGSAFAARLPFALCGLFTIIVILFWLWRSEASISTWVLMSMGLLGNVSLMLYSRQCRYYSFVILTATVLAFLYFFRDSHKKTLLVITLVSLFLLASNYLCYAAVVICLIMDYLIWGRKTCPYRYSELAVILGPQLLLGGWLVSVYNPFGKNIWDVPAASSLWEKVILFWWNFRDLNSCELGVGVLILSAPLLFFYTKDQRLLRCPVAIFIYILVISLLSPQPLRLLSVAFVRYLSPLIPICIFTAVLSIQALSVRFKWLAVPLAILAFGTNILNGGPLAGIDKKTIFSQVIAEGRFRSTAFEFTKELIAPPPSAYRETADWINQNLREKESVWVVPDFATYPLMYHAPKAMYAWQLREVKRQFKGLPEIHFMGKVPPRYVIAFGPYLQEAKEVFQRLETRGIRYVQISEINGYWYDLTRPELFWHSFREIQEYSPTSERIYIFKRS